MKVERIAIRTTPEIKQAAEQQAAADHRSLSAYIELLILADLARKDRAA